MVTDPEPIERPHIAANAALLLVSGALVAAFFLLVILLINGWRLEPLAAGLVVTVMPLAAIATARRGHAITPLWARTASGAILIAGGLAALELASPCRRRLDGAAATRDRSGSRACALGADGARRWPGRSAQAVHGGWTIAARHAASSWDCCC